MIINVTTINEKYMPQIFVQNSLMITDKEIYRRIESVHDSSNRLKKEVWKKRSLSKWCLQMNTNKQRLEILKKRFFF